MMGFFVILGMEKGLFGLRCHAVCGMELESKSLVSPQAETERSSNRTSSDMMVFFVESGEAVN